MREGCPLSLLVRNLRYTTSPDRVRRFFEQFGDVRDVYLPLDFYTKLPRGFGFVEFTRDEDAEAALQALSRYATLDGAEISVTVAQQGRKSPDSMRRRERVNHQSGRQSHSHYDDYDSRRRRGREDSRGGYHQRYYRSRSRSYDDHRHNHNRRYRMDPRWSPGAQRCNLVVRDDGNYRHASHRSRSSHSPNHLPHNELRNDDQRGLIRKRSSRSLSEPPPGYHTHKSSSRTRAFSNRHSSINRKCESSRSRHDDEGPSRCYRAEPEPEENLASHDRRFDSESRYNVNRSNRSRPPASESPERCVHRDVDTTVPGSFEGRFGSELDDKDPNSQ